MYGRNVTCQFASVLLAVCALVSGISAQDHGDRSNPEKVNAPALSQVTALRAIVGAGRLEDLRWANFPDYRVHVETFYRSSGYSLAWVRQGRPTSQAAEMIEILQHADLQGLRDEDYDSVRWTERLARLRHEHTLRDEIHFDIALTVCYHALCLRRFGGKIKSAIFPVQA